MTTHNNNMKVQDFRILLLGKNGQVGWELQRTLAPLGKIIAIDYEELDLRIPGNIREFVRKVQPNLIVNAAAYTAVDRAESEPDEAKAKNSIAPGILAQEAERLGAGFIHYSTDYVFDGDIDRPYTEEDAPNPINVYGETKLAGELAVQEIDGHYLILRTSWVYSFRRPSFPSKVLDWARNQRRIRVVEDQISSPTWCRMLAEATAQVIAKCGDEGPIWSPEVSGLYHLTCEGWCSRFDWAQEVLALDPQKDEHVVVEIHPSSSEEFPSPALRPAFSALNCDNFTKTFGLLLPNWRESLRLAMRELYPQLTKLITDC
jgi:dTDP-4-dehydrorhamnose reductase